KSLIKDKRHLILNNLPLLIFLSRFHIIKKINYFCGVESIVQEPQRESGRKPTYPINPLILNRWSPRSMSGEALNDDEIMSLFEAARWAPSSSNNQPWRFIYAQRNSEHWNRFFNLLMEPNKVWAKNAAILVVVISRKNFEFNEKPAVTHQFDTGSAWENLALEASSRDIVAHGMQGFDY